MKKIKKVKDKKYKNEDEQEISRFIKILLIVVVFILGVYFFTSTVVKKEYDINKNITKGQISNTNIIVGNVLNRPQNEYYVLVYDTTSNKVAIYDTLLNLYTSKKDALRIYSIDLNNHLNKKYQSKSTNPNAEKIEDFKFGEITLLKIKNNKVDKYLENIDAIKVELDIKKNN